MSQTQNLTTRIALELIHALRLGTDDLISPEDERHQLSAQVLYQRRAAEIWRKVRTLRPETLGIICAQAPNWYRVDSMGRQIPKEAMPPKSGLEIYYVHCGSWLGKHNDGLSLLREIAVTAIVAKIYDLFGGK
ncbi:MAG: hypothetical protein WCT37_01920 [Patescibacteria group bacterium]|jgi:hypothetical protein